jgi:murein DD-endopeptidase MepM/ murein hydrolase activator NlpD
MRHKMMLLAGTAFLITPVMATAAAQSTSEPAPVVFATDPGAAHPKFDAEEQKVVGQPAPAAQQAAMDTKIVKSGQGYTVADNGGFDYGYASNEVELVAAEGASAAPTELLTTAEMTQATEAAYSTVTYQEPANTPYRQDPIYKITDEAQPAMQPVAEVYTPERLPEGIIRVQPGDTVYALSRKYDVKPADIIAVNNLQSPYALQLDQLLKIPAQGTMQKAARPQTVATQPAPAATPATVQTIQYRTPRATQATQRYIVEQGNTMYSISRMFGLDVKTLADANNIPAPYTLSIGQQLIIPAGGKIAQQPRTTNTPAIASNGTQWSQQTTAPRNRNTYIDPQKTNATTPEAPVYQRDAAVATEAPTQAAFVKKPTIEDVLGESRFAWPVQGKIVMNYGLDENGRRNDGINIAAPVGTPIRAVEDGEVVYRGADLEGYGNLLLVKHSDGWVSAYAHTDAMLVRKGERVSKGQVIAKVGTTGSVDQPQLHFELRHELKPTDPIAALDGRNEKAIR